MSHIWDNNVYIPKIIGIYVQYVGVAFTGSKYLYMSLYSYYGEEDAKDILGFDIEKKKKIIPKLVYFLSFQSQISNNKKSVIDYMHSVFQTLLSRCC